jgi:hypothetical protein
LFVSLCPIHTNRIDATACCYKTIMLRRMLILSLLYCMVIKVYDIYPDTNGHIIFYTQ